MFLTLVGSRAGHLPRCSISVELLCCSSAASGHMLLHKIDLVVSIFLDMGLCLSHWGPVRWAQYLHKHNLHLGSIKEFFCSRQNTMSFISSFEIFHLLNNNLSFHSNSLSEITLSSFLNSYWIQSLVTLIVQEITLITSLCKPLSWLA